MIFGKYINRYYLRSAPVLLLGLLALLTVDYIQLMIPELYRLVINGVNLGEVVIDGQTLAFTKEVLFQHICLPMIYIIILMVLGRFLWRVCFFGSAVRVTADLRERMFDHSRQLSQQYYQVNKVGNLMSLYTNDLDTIQECFGDGVLMFFDALTLGLLALYKMWNMDHQLTLLALIPALIMFAIGTQMSKVMTRRWEERQEAFSGLSDFAQENFSGIAVIKAFVKEYKELQAFRKLNKENEEINVTYTKIATLLEVLVTLFVESVVCIILGYGGYLVYQGRFNAGQLVEYIGYFEAIVWPIMAISMLIEKTSRGKASLNRITELLDAPIDVADRPGVADLTDPKGGIEFRHLNFRYPDGEYDVLRDISFTIAPGESVGIVGKTGAGKTALVDLLLRTYNVPDGTLFVDGTDVNSLSIHSVRNACAYVPQDNFLFSDTIAHNIAFGVDDATPEDIERAASMADVRDNIVDFKDGYETVLGERGVTVSGGEPLLHSSVIGLLASCKSAGIGTAVESSGYVDRDILLRTAAYTDLFLYDCKDTDVSRHKAYTGVDPTLIFENLRALDALGTSRIRLRCILVSGVNTEETHYAAIVALYRSLHHCEGVEFLPYHPYGSSKSVQLGGTDTAHRAWIPTADVIDGAKSFLRKAGVPVLCE